MSYDDWLKAAAAEYSALIGRVVAASEIDGEQARASFNAAHSPVQYANLLKTRGAQIAHLNDLKWKLGSQGIYWLVMLGLFFYVCGGCFGSPIGPTSGYGKKETQETTR